MDAFDAGFITLLLAIVWYFMQSLVVIPSYPILISKQLIMLGQVGVTLLALICIIDEFNFAALSLSQHRLNFPFSLKFSSCK